MAECVASQKTIDILICPICLERFTKPKYVPCLHTFCEGCILTYSTSILEKLEGKDHINCPVCRATVQLPKKECTPREFVDQLPANFLIIGLLEKEKVTRPEKLCMSCERLDITSNATFICMDCSDTLCDTCQKYHKSNKATSNHDIKPITTLTDGEKIPKAFKNICAQHCKKLKLFCKDHDVPCCTLCVSLSHRKCDNIVTIEEEAKSFCTDAKFEKLKVDIRHVSNDFDTLLSHYTECLQSNETQYEDKQKMIEISCSGIISKVKAMEITKKAELKKLYEEKKHILEDRMDTCTNCKKTVLSDKQTLEISIEKASEVQIMIEAQKIASQIVKYKQLLRNYRFDGSKILICFGTGIPNAINVFMNSLFQIFVSNEVKFLKLLTDERIPVFNSVQKSSLNQSVGYFWNPKEDIKIRGVQFGNTTSDQKSAAGVSFQSGAKPTSAADIKFGQTTKAADSTNPAAGSGFNVDGPTVSTVKTTTAEADTDKPPLSGCFELEKLLESDKNKETPGDVSFRQTVSSTSDKKTEPSKPDLFTTEPRKSTLGVLTFQKTSKPGFSFGGETKSNNSILTFKPSAPIATASPSPAVIETNNKPVSFKPSTTFVSSTSISKPEPAKKDEKKGFGNQFKPKAGSWNCYGCLVSNNTNVLKCPACGTLKQGVKRKDLPKETKEFSAFGSSTGGFNFGGKGVTKEEAKESGQHEKKEGKKGFGDLFKPKEGAWKCDGCLVSNNGDVLKCPACGTLKPGVKKEDLPKETEKSSAFGSTAGEFNFGGKGLFTFGTAGISNTNAGSGFTFRTPDSTKDKSESKPAFASYTFTPTKSDAEKNKPDAAAKGFNFTLQSSATPGKSRGRFSFTSSPSKDAGPKSPPTDADGTYINKDGDDGHIYFEPIIELPSAVDVVTGEEGEEVLFQHRTKLFRFVDGEWKERGLGDINISKHKESGKVRLLMRRAQTHKICLEHYLTQELELKPMPKTDGKAWIWFAMDFCDDEPTIQQLAVKFKNHEIATGFKKAFDDAKVQLESSVTTQKSPVSSVGDSDDRNDGIEFVREEQATKEQITMARKFLLPDHFYLYEKKPSCPGCIGCEDYEPGKKSPAKSKILVK